ncbi:DNA binding domain-containing protein, excisionase family [Nitrosomonas aestuarii]|uniref:DNA binding domain-containing protein, excisionase family n=2 Tax=Nitrosomonas aestuarii TaxID=52441 RepID=A0A1I4B9X9_9PROT|nr:DNA binding domain-containing protein, excisionase family [Nitrosomonas aestuarii]
MNESNLTISRIIKSDELSKEVDAAEAAKFIGVTVSTLAAWRCTKKQNIPFYKIGSKVRYKISDLVAWKEEQRVC